MLRNPCNFQQLHLCLFRGLKVRKDRLYYGLCHAEAYGVYLRACRERRERVVVAFARDVLGDKQATWEGL